jgi:phosphoribosyl 1,2-cyclic phosphodiesterase
MPLDISSLNSGSNGNCYYIGNSEEAVLVDVGISCRETERRMKTVGLEMEKVKAVFVTHEHTDHISGVAVLSRKYQLPVYITEETERFGRLKLDKQLIRRFKANDVIVLGSLQVMAFPKYHDAADPHSFLISSGSINIGVFTDIGRNCKEVIHHFKQCHAAFLESNYDEDMLMNGGYPAHLKKRISNGNGHLSNSEALELFNKHRPAFMSHLILSHLSKNNNHPEIVEKLFAAHAKQVEIYVASRYEPSPVFTISDNGYAAQPVRKQKKVKPEQLKLF